MYEESPSPLTGAVRWWSIAESADPVRVIPDGCMDLIWDGARVLVAGPDTHAHVHTSRAGQHLVGLRLAPGDGPLVLGRPADELVNERVDLDALWHPGRVRSLTDRLAESPTATAAASLLEQAAREAGGGEGHARRLTRAIAELAERGHASASIADQVGYSSRQLQRRCRSSFGYGAKTLVRILRMQRALRLVHAGAMPARAACDAGYADEPHLYRDVKDLTGVPFSALRR